MFGVVRAPLRAIACVLWILCVLPFVLVSFSLRWRLMHAWWIQRFFRGSLWILGISYSLKGFVWQTMDEAPRFPRLAQFLEHWRREIDAVIHSIRIAHADWVGPTEIRPIDGEFRLS